MPEARKCPNCGSRLTKKARFCPECGVRVEEGGTVIQQLPQEETGPVPVEITTAAPRFFGVTPPAAVLVLGAASLALEFWRRERCDFVVTSSPQRRRRCSIWHVDSATRLLPRFTTT